VTTIELPFSLGVTVWHAAYGYESWWIECPECLGTKKVKVSLATGEEYELECRCCQEGYEPSRGKIQTGQSRFTPTLFTPGRFRIEGAEVWYSESSPDASSYSSVSADVLFLDKAACAARCDEENAKHDKERAEQALRNLMHKRKDYAWSVHYWRGQLKQKRRDVELIEARLVEVTARKRFTAQNAPKDDRG
jgi:hypothetical protein